MDRSFSTPRRVRCDQFPNRTFASRFHWNRRLHLQTNLAKQLQQDIDVTGAQFNLVGCWLLGNKFQYGAATILADDDFI